MTMTGDDAIYDLLLKNGISINPDDAEKDLEEMKGKIQELRTENTGEEIKDKTNNLDDEKSTSGSGGGNVAVANNVASSNATTNYNQVSDARNDEGTIAALLSP